MHKNSKNTGRKLVLRKETIRLADAEAEQVVGGMPRLTFGMDCPTANCMTLGQYCVPTNNCMTLGQFCTITFRG